MMLQEKILTVWQYKMSVENIHLAIEQLYKIVENKKYMDLIPRYYDDINDSTASLGVLFGQLVCNSYGWKWRAVGDSEGKNYISIVSPNEYFCLFPLHYINKIVSEKNIGLDGENDNTIILLYNMLAKVEEHPRDMLLCPLG